MAVPLISRGDIGDIFSKKRDYPVNKTRYETPLDPYLPNFMNKKPIHSPAFQVEVVKVCPEKLTRESDAKKETKKKAGSSSALVNRGQFGFVPVPGIAASIRKKQAAYAPMFVSKESISRFFLKKAFAYFPLLKPMGSQFFSSPSRASLGGASIKHSVPQGIRPQLMGLAAVDELKTTGSAEQERKIAREKEEKMAKEQAGKQAKNIWKFSQLLKVTSDTLKALASISPEIGLAHLAVSAVYSASNGGIAVKEKESGRTYKGWRAPFSYKKRAIANGAVAVLSVSAHLTLNALVGIVAAPVGIVASLLGIGKASYDIKDKKAEIKIGKEALKMVTDDAKKTSLVSEVIKTMKADILGNRLGIAARTLFIGSSTTAIVGFAVTGAAISLGFAALPVVGQVALGLMLLGTVIFIVSAVIRVNAQRNREALELQLKESNINFKAKPKEDLRKHFQRSSSVLFGISELNPESQIINNKKNLIFQNREIDFKPTVKVVNEPFRKTLEKTIQLLKSLKDTKQNGYEELVDKTLSQDRVVGESGGGGEETRGTYKKLNNKEEELEFTYNPMMRENSSDALKGPVDSSTVYNPLQVSEYISREN